jgi:hypothetical protein
VFVKGCLSRDKHSTTGTKMKICTEADYLQAHLTVIVGGLHERHTALHNFKQRLASILKKWILATERRPDRTIDSTGCFALPACPPEIMPEAGAEEPRPWCLREA